MTKVLKPWKTTSKLQNLIYILSSFYTILYPVEDIFRVQSRNCHIYRVIWSRFSFCLNSFRGHFAIFGKLGRRGGRWPTERIQRLVISTLRVQAGALRFAKLAGTKFYKRPRKSNWCQSDGWTSTVLQFIRGQFRRRDSLFSSEVVGHRDGSWNVFRVIVVKRRVVAFFINRLY